MPFHTHSRFLLRLKLGFFFSLLFVWLADAATLSVTPTKIEVPGQSNHTTLTVKSSASVAVQVRVFEWTEGRPATQLRKTRNVAVSPPMARLKGRSELTIRVVRKTKRSKRGRDCYRVLIDMLPEQNQSSFGVGLRVRHSVPLCFIS